MELINKTCCVVCHGNSLNILEQRILEFKNLDVVWCGINYFNPSEEILKKINKSFSIVFDCSTVKNALSYELVARLPRLKEFLNRENTKYITLKTGRDNLYELRNRIDPDFNEKYKNKILYGEDLFFDTNQFCVSLHLYLTILLKLGASKIILFGADGGGLLENNVDSYYNPELMKVDKLLAHGNLEYNMVGDNANVNTTFEPIMKSIFGYVPEILNCSPITKYTVFSIITYDEAIQKI